ncbi:hypothetical protein Btru_075999 [Bulinus truncatus]|nr:hypothetical protein Btru_075999 [Bulinus truncatus]
MEPKLSTLVVTFLLLTLFQDLSQAAFVKPLIKPDLVMKTKPWTAKPFLTNNAAASGSNSGEGAGDGTGEGAGDGIADGTADGTGGSTDYGTGGGTGDGTGDDSSNTCPEDLTSETQ